MVKWDWVRIKTVRKSLLEIYDFVKESTNYSDLRPNEGVNNVFSFLKGDGLPIVFSNDIEN